jgi:hypothetical protein
MTAAKLDPEKYPDWTIWQAGPIWHAANVDNVGYAQCGSESEMVDFLNSYGKADS